MNPTQQLRELIDSIGPLDDEAMSHARARQSQLTKPVGSLGKLEDLSIQIAGITGEQQPQLKHKAIAVMAGDHGVVAEGVSAYPQEVTPQMVLNFLYGGAAINVLARHIGARVVIVDMGVASDLPDHSDLIQKKIAPGTNNIARGAAMSAAQAEAAIIAGADIIKEQHSAGLDILATGDMGIGNTTPSAAIASAITAIPPAEIVGRGTGVDDKGLARKIAAVENALRVNKPDPGDGLEILSKVGGFEIGGICGAILSAASRRVPVVIDGFISTAAAMIAVLLAPGARDYLIAGHVSQELGHQAMMDWLQISPLLDLDMRLGEGTGAALAISLAEASCKILAEMATFADAGVSGKSEA
jgi:nicotinate-nucleotide--dimethylbenzimidazole phosphoribosyltransferase